MVEEEGLKVNLWILVTQITLCPTYPPLKHPPHFPFHVPNQTYLFFKGTTTSSNSEQCYLDQKTHH